MKQYDIQDKIKTIEEKIKKLEGEMYGLNRINSIVIVGHSEEEKIAFLKSLRSDSNRCYYSDEPKPNEECYFKDHKYFHVCFDDPDYLNQKEICLKKLEKSYLEKKLEFEKKKFEFFLDELSLFNKNELTLEEIEEFEKKIEKENKIRRICMSNGVEQTNKFTDCTVKIQ